MQINVAVISVTAGDFHLVTHIVTVIFRSEKKGATRPCPTDGLLQQIRMLGKTFQVHALSSRKVT